MRHGQCQCVHRKKDLRRRPAARFSEPPKLQTCCRQYLRKDSINPTVRTILITGGSAGIGLAFALKFLELGNQVIVTGRRQSVLDELKAKYPELHTIQSDVADPAQIAVLARRVKDGYPQLDVLMNNAGIMLHKNLKV